MLHSLIQFAAESEPNIHIAPSEVFKIGGTSITNSILYAWISSVVILGILIYVARRITIKPRGGLTQIIEIGSEFITNLIGSSLGSREKGVKYAPYFVSIFFFIVFSNLLGLLPGVGEALTVNGAPLLRPFTADLNGTLAMASITMLLVQAFAIKESGLTKHVRHYFAGSLYNPVTYLMGIFEVFSEFTRVVSLALRLGLNVAIGEIIILVFTFLGKFAAPVTSLPFVILELFVGALQAYIFVMLAIMYLAVAVKHDESEHQAEVAAEHESVNDALLSSRSHG